jgi:hypothetical protein
VTLEMAPEVQLPMGEFCSRPDRGIAKCSPRVRTAGHVPAETGIIHSPGACVRVGVSASGAERLDETCMAEGASPA